MRLIRHAIVATLVAVPAFAQSCPNANPNCTTGFTGGNANIFALIMTAPAGGITITGLDLKTSALRGGGNVGIELYLPTSTGVPALPAAAKGTVNVSGGYGWYGGNYNKAITIKGGTRYFISLNGAAMTHPICRTGGTTRTSYYWHPPNATAWRGTFTQAWVYRVRCNGGYGSFGKGCPGSNNKVPAIGATGVPKIGASFSVTLENAKPATLSFLFLGASDKSWGPITLPLDLSRLGGPGCNLLCSGEVQIGTPVDNSGNAAQKLTLPNNSWLVGKLFYNQWLVFDPTANALKYVFSDGGSASIGK